MSIYATLGVMRVDGVEIFVQGVPAHIDYTGPEWEFLGPVAEDVDGSELRTVFVIEDLVGKRGQRYNSWLLQLTPEEYAATSWPELRKRIHQVLHARLKRCEAGSSCPYPARYHVEAPYDTLDVCGYHKRAWQPNVVRPIGGFL